MKRSIALFLALGLVLTMFAAVSSAETYTETVRGMFDGLTVEVTEKQPESP